MAKKRKTKARKTRAKRSYPKAQLLRTTPKHPLKGAYRVADVFVGIAVLFTLIQAVLVLISPSRIVQIAVERGGPAWALTTSGWITIAIAWIFLAIFARVANKIVKGAMTRKTMWGLFIIGLLMVIIANPISGVLVLIAAIIYLAKASK